MAVTKANAQTTFKVWLGTVGGMTTEDARTAGLPITGTFRIEDLSIQGEGRTRLRVAQITNESGGERNPLGEKHSSPAELVDLLNAGIRTLEVAERMTKA